MEKKYQNLGGYYLSIIATRFLVAASAHAQIGEVTVAREGVSATKKSAIMDAIKEALIQVNGASVAASTMFTVGWAV